jgi:uncharacterized protein YjgD (DUF1641 family)
VTDPQGDPLAEALADPEVRAGLARILERMDRLEAIVETFGRFAETVPTIADAAGTTATWAWEQAEKAGVDPIATGQRSAKLLLELGKPEVLDLLERMLSRRVQIEQALEMLDAQTSAEIEPVGPWAAFGRMRDPDVKRAVGFALAFAKRLGRSLGRG